MDTTDTVRRVWLKDFEYYAIWFFIWGGLFSSLQPVTSEQMEDIGFWSVKVQQTLLGLGFGLICAAVFSVLQNGINPWRKKRLSWILAIGTWLVMSLALPYVVGRVG